MADELNIIDLQILDDYNYKFPSNKLGTASDLLISTMLFVDCPQANSIKNFNNVMLDIDFNNSKAIVSCADDSIEPCDRHHPSLVINIYI